MTERSDPGLLRWLAVVVIAALVGAGVSGALVALVLESDDNTPSSAVQRVSRPDAADLESVADVVSYAMPAVVTVINEGPTQRDGSLNLAIGTGVIVDERGFIVTNEHVIHDAGKLRVVLSNGEERSATLVSDDAPFTDIAVLRVVPGDLTSLPFGESQSLRLGEPVVAIGSALFEFRNSVSTGVVSGLGRRWLRNGVFMEDLVQTDTAINSGNSGGPLLNLQGEIVGLNAAVVRTFGSADTVQGISFAIGSQTLQPIVTSIIERGRYPRPYFGIEHQNVDADLLATTNPGINRGALVRRVIDGGPAAKAGIRAGDVILRIGSAELNDNVTFINALAKLGLTDKPSVEVWRAGRSLELTVEVQPR